MNQEKPKVYTAEFRDWAVKLTKDSDKPIAQTAKDIGLMKIHCIPGSANTADLSKMLSRAH